MSAFRRLGQVDGGQGDDCANLHTESDTGLPPSTFWQQTLDLPQGTLRSNKAATPCRTSTRTAEVEEADTEHLRLASRADMVRLLPVSREGTDSSHLVVDTARPRLVSRVDTEHRLRSTGRIWSASSGPAGWIRRWWRTAVVVRSAAWAGIRPTSGVQLEHGTSSGSGSAAVAVVHCGGSRPQRPDQPAGAEPGAGAMATGRRSIWTRSRC